MSDKRYRSRKQKIRHEQKGCGSNKRKNKPKNKIDIYRGDRRAA